MSKFLLTLKFLIFISCVTGNNILANTKKTPEDGPPGILESINNFVHINREHFTKAMKSANAYRIKRNDLKEIKEIAISTPFIKTILFNSDSKYINMISGNNGLCNFYALMENNLLKTTNGLINDVLIDIITKNKIKKTVLVSKKILLEHIYKTRCFKNKSVSTIFNSTNYLKTINSIKFKIPKNRNECQKIFDEWKTHLYLPYICKFPESISLSRKIREKIKRNRNYQTTLSALQRAITSSGRRYEKQIPLFQQTYMENLCRHIESPDKFCNTYLSPGFWEEIVRGEKPLYYMQHRCKLLLRNNKLDTNKLRQCIKLMNDDINRCTTLGITQYPSFFPKPDCKTMEKALSVSRLKTSYQDCPGRIDYENIVNINRILEHFSDDKKSTNPSACVYETMEDFANIVISATNNLIWPLKICYINPVDNKNKCESYIPGQHPSSSLAEQKVMAKILNRIKGSSYKEDCKIIDKTQYNPFLLQYKNGCFIVVDKMKCTGFNCPKNIYFRGKIITGIKYEGKLRFEYFPNSYMHEKNSMDHIIRQKFALKSNRIPNLTILTNFLKNNPNAIIHGVGCAENLLPRFFRSHTLSDCSPTPFIIDGVFDNTNELLLSVRTPMDDVHTPRLIMWNKIFAAITGFQRIHPLNTWMLYGIRK